MQSEKALGSSPGEYEKGLCLILRAGNSVYLRGRMTSLSSYVNEKSFM